MNKNLFFLIFSLLFYNQIYALKQLVITKNTIVRQIPTKKYLETHEKDLEYTETQSDEIYYGTESFNYLTAKFPNISMVVSNAEEYQFFQKTYKNTNNYSFWLVTKDYKVEIISAISFWETYMQFADCTNKTDENCVNYHRKTLDLQKNFVDK